MNPRPPRAASVCGPGLSGRLARAAIPVCVAGLATPFLTTLLTGGNDRVFWFADLMTHWQWLFAAALLGALAVTVANDLRRAALAPLAALPLFSAAPGLPEGGTSPVLAVASANIHASTRDPRRLIDWLASVQPDIVVVLEVSPPAAIVLAGVHAYPYRIIQPDESPFGIALLSRLPIEAADVVQGDDGIRHIRAEVAFAGRTVSIGAVHPMPPLSPRYHAQRDAQLRARIHEARQGPAIVAGDLNATPWSSAFIGMADQGWRRATGLLPTWPAWGRGVFGIPIDQVIASAEWRLVDRRIGPDLGSDHLPVLVRLALKPASGPPPAGSDRVDAHATARHDTL